MTTKKALELLQVSWALIKENEILLELRWKLRRRVEREVISLERLGSVTTVFVGDERLNALLPETCSTVRC
jgi:hypothetical protein